MSNVATSRRRTLTLALKLAVTAALLVVVARLADPLAAARELGGVGAGALLLAFTLNGLSIVVSAARWQRVLARLGERVPLGALVGDVLVGTTYNLLLPTSIGGDVARSVRCARRVSAAEHAWASVAFERLVGLLALVAVSGAGLATIAGGTAGGLGVVAAAVVALVIGALVGLPPLLRAASGVRRLGWTRPAEAFERVAAALSGPLASPAARAEALAWSVGYHVTALALLVPLGWGWGEPRLLEAIFLGIPLALVATVLPISVGGLGVRESLLVVVLAPFGLSASRALALGAAWLVSMVVAALAGALVLLLEPRQASRPAE